jgi:hypothetical protein
MLRHMFALAHMIKPVTYGRMLCGFLLSCLIATNPPPALDNLDIRPASAGPWRLYDLQSVCDAQARCDNLWRPGPRFHTEQACRDFLAAVSDQSVGGDEQVDGDGEDQGEEHMEEHADGLPDSDVFDCRSTVSAHPHVVGFSAPRAETLTFQPLHTQ